MPAINGPYALIKFEIAHTCAALGGKWSWGQVKTAHFAQKNNALQLTKTAVKAV